MNEKDASWHAERLKGIGGSDANILMSGDEAAIHRLWLEKRGEREPEDLTWVLPVQIGIVTEALNIAWLAHAAGLDITADGQSRAGGQADFMRCNPDGLTADAVIECKHVGQFQEMEKITQKYMPQLHHNMIVTARTKSILSVFRGTTEHHWFEVDLDEFYAAELMEREREFWACVESGKPPGAMPAIAPPVPPEKWRKVDMTGHNEFAAFAADWLASKTAAKVFDAAAKGIKSLMEPDMGEAYGHGVVCKRARNGNLTIREG